LIDNPLCVPVSIEINEKFHLASVLLLDQHGSRQVTPFKGGSREAIIVAKIRFRKDIIIKPIRARGVFLADQMITSAVLNGQGRLPRR
jgi:hypothetical protein